MDVSCRGDDAERHRRGAGDRPCDGGPASLRRPGAPRGSHLAEPRSCRADLARTGARTGLRHCRSRGGTPLVSDRRPHDRHRRRNRTLPVRRAAPRHADRSRMGKNPDQRVGLYRREAAARPLGRVDVGRHRQGAAVQPCRLRLAVLPPVAGGLLPDPGPRPGGQRRDQAGLDRAVRLWPRSSSSAAPSTSSS